MHIEFRQPSDRIDIQYIESILKSDIFLRSIGEYDSYDDFLVIFINNQRNGLLKLDYIDNSVLFVYPTIIIEKPTLYSPLILGKVCNFIFKKMKAHFILIKVWSNNYRMINMLNNLEIKSCGSIFDVDVNGLSIIYFQIFEKDYSRIINEW